MSSHAPHENGSLGLHDVLQQMSFDFVNAATAACISKTSVAPVERMKLLLQTRFIHDNRRIPAIINQIISEQGMISFWRGNLPNIIRYFPLQGLILSFKEQLKFIFVPQASDASYVSILCGNVISGGLSGCFAITIIYPLDLTRTRLAVDMGGGGANNNTKREFRGIIHCLTSTYKSGGVLSWYSGLGASWCCYFIYRGLQIGGYDGCKRIFKIDLKNGKKWNKSILFLQSFSLSYSMTCFAMTMAYPFDTVRRKMMLQAGIEKQARMYKNSTQCWFDLVQQNGTKILYKGLGVSYVRALGSSLVLVLFDCFKMYYTTNQ